MATKRPARKTKTKQVTQAVTEPTVEPGAEPVTEPTVDPTAESETNSVQVPLSGQFSMIDDYMKEKAHWVCLLDGRYINPKDGSDAFVDIPESWATLNEACKYIEHNEGSRLGFELGRDSNITAIHFSNCFNADGTFNNVKMENIIKAWEDMGAMSYVEYDADKSGLLFLFAGTPITQQYGYTATDNDIEVTIADSYECIPLTGNYYDISDCILSKNELKLTAGNDVLQRTYEQFFGIKTGNKQSILQETDIDVSLTGLNVNDYFKRKLTVLLRTNKYFNNLWNRTTPTDRGKLADEIDIIARIMKYLSCDEMAVCEFFRASPYFRTRPKAEQVYYENLYDNLYELLAFDDATATHNEDKISTEETVSDSKAFDKPKDVMRDFASPYMRRLLDKAKELLKKKSFRDNNYDNDIELVYDPIYETVNTPNTDVACAKILIKTYGDRMKYCTEDDCWYIYNGAFWERENNKDFEHIRKFGATITDRLSIIPTWFNMPVTKKRVLAREANKFSNVPSLNRIVEAARAVKPVSPEFFNLGINKLNVGNGTVDLKTGRLFEHSAKDFFTTHTDVKYMGSYPKPRKFESFLKEIFLDDTELIEYVRRILGYCITGETKEQKLFVFHGAGQNGKSTLINILHEVLNDYVGNFDSYALASKNEGSGRANPALIQNRYTRLVIVSEKSENTKFDLSMLKAITGGDKISARMLFQNNKEPFRPKYKLIFTENSFPDINLNEKSISRRFVFIPFNKTFKDEEVDPEIANKILADEKEMILTWLIDAAKDYLESGLGDKPYAVIAAEEEAGRQTNSVSLFVSEKIEITHEDDDFIHVKKLYNKYKKWCKDNHINKPKKSLQFQNELIIKYNLSKPTIRSNDSARSKSYTGIKYKSVENSEPSSDKQ